MFALEGPPRTQGAWATNVRAFFPFVVFVSRPPTAKDVSLGMVKGLPGSPINNNESGDLLANTIELMFKNWDLCLPQTTHMFLFISFNTSWLV